MHVYLLLYFFLVYLSFVIFHWCVKSYFLYAVYIFVIFFCVCLLLSVFLSTEIQRAPLEQIVLNIKMLDLFQDENPVVCFRQNIDYLYSIIINKL